MIESVRHKGLRRLYEDADRSKVPAELAERMTEILSILDAAHTVAALDLPSYRLHELKGARRGTWSVTVRANWRITFRFQDGAALDVDFEDDH